MSAARMPGQEPAHDVLAAEEFAVPAPDPRLNHGPVELPDDPTGIAEPHDVLAAEEFAMPAPYGQPSAAELLARERRRQAVPLIGVGILLSGALARRRLRRR